MPLSFTLLLFCGASALISQLLLTCDLFFSLCAPLWLVPSSLVLIRAFKRQAFSLSRLSLGKYVKIQRLSPLFFILLPRPSFPVPRYARKFVRLILKVMNGISFPNKRSPEIILYQFWDKCNFIRLRCTLCSVFLNIELTLLHFITYLLQYIPLFYIYRIYFPSTEVFQGYIENKFCLSLLVFLSDIVVNYSQFESNCVFLIAARLLCHTFTSISSYNIHVPCAISSYAWRDLVPRRNKISLFLLLILLHEERKVWIDSCFPFASSWDPRKAVSLGLKGQTSLTTTRFLSEALPSLFPSVGMLLVRSYDTVLDEL